MQGLEILYPGEEGTQKRFEAALLSGETICFKDKLWGNVRAVIDEIDYNHDDCLAVVRFHEV